jgi:iron-sulfur cluster assembly protein/iron-sulfur cluster insertion protein
MKAFDGIAYWSRPGTIEGATAAPGHVRHFVAFHRYQGVTMSVTDTAPVADPTRAINVTDVAALKIAELIASESSADPLMLRVAVRPGGCSGFSYEMYFDTERAEDDVIESFGQGDAVVQVAIDPTSVQLIKGATLEYKDGLQGAGFSINNPNASRTCGCGSSFS